MMAAALTVSVPMVLIFYFLQGTFVRSIVLRLQALCPRMGVLYRASVAFWAECCRFVIGSADVCYTENLANPSAQDFTPHPAQ